MSVASLRDVDRLEGGDIALEALAARHRETLRAACAADPDIWTIYPYSMLGDAFDAWWDVGSDPARRRFAVVAAGEVVGTTSFLAIDPANASVEIGATYLAPTVRGTTVNPAAKRLMLGAAFDHGVRRVELRVDGINRRSCAAVEKLGATLDGILRAHRITWTGRVRDTVVYAILADEWPGVRERLDARLAEP